MGKQIQEDSTSKTSVVEGVRISFAQRPKWLLRFSSSPRKTSSPGTAFKEDDYDQSSPSSCLTSDGILSELCKRAGLETVRESRAGHSEGEQGSGHSTRASPVPSLSSITATCPTYRQYQASLFRKLDGESKSLVSRQTRPQASHPIS